VRRVSFDEPLAQKFARGWRSKDADQIGALDKSFTELFKPKDLQ